MRLHVSCEELFTLIFETHHTVHIYLWSPFFSPRQTRFRCISRVKKIKVKFSESGYTPHQKIVHLSFKIQTSQGKMGEKMVLEKTKMPFKIII